MSCNVDGGVLEWTVSTCHVLSFWGYSFVAHRAREPLRFEHFMASLPAGCEHHTTSLITFFCTVARQNTTAFETSINVGFFEMLLWLYQSPHFGWNDSSPDTNNILISTCESAFLELLYAPPTLRHLLDRHINRLWVSDGQPCLSKIAESVNACSEYIWLELEARFWEREYLAWDGFIERSSLIFEPEGSPAFGAFPRYLAAQEKQNR